MPGDPVTDVRAKLDEAHAALHEAVRALDAAAAQAAATRRGPEPGLWDRVRGRDAEAVPVHRGLARQAGSLEDLADEARDVLMRLGAERSEAGLLEDRG